MDTISKKREEVINKFLDRNILISAEFVEFLKSDDTINKIHTIICDKESKGENFDLESIASEFLEMSGGEVRMNTSVIFNYDEEPKKKTVSDFVNYFRQRLKAIESILRARPELQNIISINRMLTKKDRESVALIGMVKNKSITKNGNLMITLEDNTGFINVLVNKNKNDLFEMAKDIVFDEVIGVTGMNGERIIFADSIIFPDIPLTKELKKAQEQKYIVFISDIHFGSEYFLEKNFSKFLLWLSGNVGSDAQKSIAKNITHLFIIGDLVDGLGIYPGQEKELTIPDIYEQYKVCAEYLARVPKNINIVMCPGNHDAMRIAEPQPPLYEDFAEHIYKLPNITIVSNPAMINIGKTDNFEGFDILLYHGFSFDYYMANVESIRNNGGYDRADLMMKFLLQKRHLAPTYSSTLFVPTPDKDNLVISKIPDIFATGHIHKCSIPFQKNVNYRNITLISGSTWQSTTPFQEKVGHHPEPCRVPIVNLQTREVKILNFENI